MKRFLLGPVLFFLLFVRCVSAQDAAAIWTAASRATLDAAKSASVANLTIVRDCMRITLLSGTLEFSQPVNGRVFAAVFRGQGRLQMSVADPREVQQLRLFSDQDSVDLPFSEAVLNFSTDVFGELAPKLSWSPSAENIDSAYQNWAQYREEHAFPLTPRVMQSLLSSDGKRDAFLIADIKSSDRGWMIASYDARDHEEMGLLHWADRDYPGQLDTWLSFPAGNRTASEAFHDPLEKSAYSIQAYQIDAHLAADAELSATSTVQFQPLVSGDRAFLFTLDANLRIDSVKDETGAPVPYFQAREPKDRRPGYGDFVVVVLPAAPPAGKHSLQFHYAGKHAIRNVGSGNYFAESYGWYPAYGDSNAFATRANFNLTFTYPKKFSLVATGDKTGEASDGKQTTSTWKSPIPLAVAGFSFGDYKISTQKVGDIQVDAYVNRNQDDTLGSISTSLNSELPNRDYGSMAAQESRPAAAVGNLNPADLTKAVNTEMANTLRVFQDYYGPFPYDRVAVTNIPYSYGQGWPMLLFLSSFSFLDSTQRHALGIHDQIGISDFFRAHEMSHQWWGHRVGWKSYHDQWMSEGFAQFSGNLYVQFRDNPGEYLNRIRIDRQALLNKNRNGHVYESLGPVWMGERLASSKATDGYDVVIYDKGGLVLHSLRMMLHDPKNPDPDHNFKEMMKDFCNAYDNKPASTEDFKAIVEKHMVPPMDAEGNHRMDWFFRQYVYGTGIPEYKLNYKVEQVADKWVVSGEITRSGVPDNWVDALRVYVALQGKDPVPVGWMRAGANTVPLKFQLPVKPDKVLLDADEDSLVVIK
jgi:hypothetical protein